MRDYRRIVEWVDIVFGAREWVESSANAAANGYAKLPAMVKTFVAAAIVAWYGDLELQLVAAVDCWRLVEEEAVKMYWGWNYYWDYNYCYYYSWCFVNFGVCAFLKFVAVACC